MKKRSVSEEKKLAVLKFLEESGGACMSDIIEGTGLKIGVVHNALTALVLEGKAQRFKASFNSARKHGQSRVFGTRKKWFYYSNKDKFLEWLADKMLNFTRERGMSGVNGMLARRLEKGDIKKLKAILRSRMEG